MENVIDGFDDNVKLNEELDQSSFEGGNLIPRSETALVIDAWTARIGKQLLLESKPLQARCELQPYDYQYKGSKAYGKHRDAWHKQASDAGEFFAAAFESDVEFAQNTAKPELQKYLRSLLASPQFQSLKQNTFLDVDAASTAASGLFGDYVVYVKEQEQQQGESNGDGKLPGNGPGSDIARSVAKAKQQVKDNQDACDALGIGVGNGQASSLARDKVTKAFARVRNSVQLQKICQAAGKWRAHAAATQRQKTETGFDTICGTTIGGEIERLLPQEYSALAGGADLELLVMKKILEREAAVRQYEGWEPAARGPIVVLVDESGSMTHDDRITQAKAMALSMAWIARQQNRWCCLVGFAGNKNYSIHTCIPGKPDPDGLCNWLQHFFNGGTTTEVLMDSLPRDWEKIGAPKGKTDILMITDGQMSIYPCDPVKFLAWKKLENVKLSIIGVGVGDGPEAIGEIGQIADTVHTTQQLGVDSSGVTEAFSV